MTISQAYQRILEASYTLTFWMAIITAVNSAISESNAKHAQKHADCTRDEVQRILREKGSWVADYLGGLSDSELERTAHLGPAHGGVTVQRFIESSILHQGKEHMANIKAAAGA